MLMRRLIASMTVAALVGLPIFAAASESTDIIVADPELTIARNGGNETCALPGSGYEDLVVDDHQATFTLLGQALPEGSKRLVGRGISRVHWAPGDNETQVTIEFARPPSYHMVNVVNGTPDRPQTPQVVAGFGFESAGSEHRARAVMGGGQPKVEHEQDQYGSYNLPEFPPVKYSDALVTLEVHNTDFRDVLWLMSQIGNISIVLDPYWADEPTGGPRTPGGGANPEGGGGGAGQPGFRPGGEFLPQVPREGTGNLTLKFENVPFDMALDLILMSVGLYKVDIYPGSLD
jgi:hypothetical protein